MENTVIVITGPTASGKTSAAIEVAKHFGTKIISADSRQCFKELNIGVARPSIDELQTVEHFFIASHSIVEKITANDFETYALEKVDEVFNTNKVAILTGGTGLYIKAFCEGLDEIPEVEESVRNRIVNLYNENGLAWLQKEVEKKDPLFWQNAEKQNPQRLMRALEVMEGTGRSILAFRTGKKKRRPFRIIKIAIDISKEKLHDNIEKRVAWMFENGLLSEVTALLPYQHLNALQTVGYQEVFDYANGKISLQTTREKVIKNTKQYAKRQLTWFRKDKAINWIEKEEILQYLISNLEQ